tara:strand:+ start:899 stop:1126 length:228 start_codon:yes stop_codon:yes gene_type:complete
MKSDDLRSGMVGDKEVEMHQLSKFVWAIDVVRHTSDDTKELVEGWEIGDESKALALFDSTYLLLLEQFRDEHMEE